MAHVNLAPGSRLPGRGSWSLGESEHLQWTAVGEAADIRPVQAQTSQLPTLWHTHS